MLLRRVMEHVKAQNWTAVALDFVIVVLGVFIGIQVANWNDAISDRELEREYLERLLSDMTNGIDAIMEDTDWDEYRLTSQTLVLDALRSGQLKEEDKQDFTRGLLFIGVHNPIRRQWGTVEELKSTGNIALLRDKTLRDMIAQADASFERRNKITEQSEARLSLYRTQILAYLEPISYGLSTTDEATANYDFDSLAADQAFINLLAAANLEAYMLVEFSKGYIYELEAIRDHLAELLKDDHTD